MDMYRMVRYRGERGRAFLAKCQAAHEDKKLTRNITSIKRCLKAKEQVVITDDVRINKAHAALFEDMMKLSS